jgi:hypothetical protein
MDDVLVTIATFRDLPEALLAQGKLRSAGFDAYLADDNMVRMDWFWSNAIGGIRLRVAPGDAETAMAELAEPPPETFTLDEVGALVNQPHCPACNSRDISYRDTNRWISLAILWATALPIPLAGGNWRCDACGVRWVVEGELEE